MAPRLRPTPPTQMREALALLRDSGIEFDAAWEQSLAAIKWPYDTSHRRQWREALRISRDEFRSAYEGEVTRTSVLASALLSAITSTEGLDPNEYELRAVA